jgi:hypothetical protein
VRIETTGAQIFQHSHPAVNGPYAEPFEPTGLSVLKS